MAKMVADMVMVRSALRERKDDHVRVSTAGPSARLYYVVGSSHPQNPRTMEIHVHRTHAREIIPMSCGVRFCRSGATVAQYVYGGLENFEAIVGDVLNYMDVGSVRDAVLPITSQTQRKGVTST